MRAVIFKRSGGSGSADVVIEKRSIPTLPPSYALVKLEYAALNRRDHWIRKGLYPKAHLSDTVGSDAYGEVVDVSGIDGAEWIGKKVILNPGQNWGPRIRGHDIAYGVLGHPPYPGALAEYIAIPIDRLHRPPSHLSPPQLAALPLATLTAYRALVTVGEAKAGQWVLVTGVGGGVALAALQLAVAIGCHVLVTSSSSEKIQHAIKLGAKAGFDYTSNNWIGQMQKYLDKEVPRALTRCDVLQKQPIPGLDLVVDGSGGPSLNAYLQLLRNGGIISMYGATSGLCENFLLHALFLKNCSLRGVTMGNDDEFKAMLELVESKKIVPWVDAIFPFTDEGVNEAFDRMGNSKQFGKIVIQLSGEQAKQTPRSKL